MGFFSHAKNSNRNGPHSPEPEGAPNTAALGSTARERLLKPQGQNRLPKRRTTKMAICTFNALTLASEACIEDLMMQARKVKYDVIGLTETRRHRPLHVVFGSGEELFLGTCDSRGVGCDLERLYREDHTFFKVIVGDFNAKIGPRRTAEELHIETQGVEWNEQVRGERAVKFRKRSPKTSINWNHFASLASKSVIDNIDEECNRLVEHLYDRARKALTSELAKLCREAIKEDLKERRAAVVGEAADAATGIRKARRNFANYETKITSLRRLDGSVTASRRAAKKVIYASLGSLRQPRPPAYPSSQARRLGVVRFTRQYNEVIGQKAQ
ncbi:hypothetical protein V3C99_018593 [Haemonchus contortus]